MPGRRRRARCIGFEPGYICFKPCGRPGRGLETVELRADELEALRLSDIEGLYQEECARRMQISRTTLSRTLTEAHRKVADALLHGKRLDGKEDGTAGHGVVCGPPVYSRRWLHAKAPRRPGRGAANKVSPPPPAR